MEKTDWDKYVITTERWVSYEGDKFDWHCNAFGARATSKKLYQPRASAIAACKRWIRKHGVKP